MYVATEVGCSEEAGKPAARVSGRSQQAGSVEASGRAGWFTPVPACGSAEKEVPPSLERPRVSAEDWVPGERTEGSVEGQLREPSGLDQLLPRGLRV